MTQLENSAFKVKASRVPNVSLIKPEPGTAVINDTDGRLYTADLYGWRQAGSGDDPMPMFFNYNGVDQYSWGVKLPVGKTLTIDWGDGTTTDYAGQGETFGTMVSAYTVPGMYYIRLLGDALDITWLNWGDQYNSYGSINNFTKLKDLVYVGITGLNWYGSVESLKGFAGELYLKNMKLIEGDCSFLNETAKAIDIERCPGTRFGSVAQFTIRDTWVMSFTLNDWPTRDIDDCLESLAGVTNCRVNVYGKHARSAQSNAFVATLAGDGCTVVVTEPRPFVGLGPDLVSVPSAVSDPAGNETDGLDGWTPTGLGSPNEFISQRTQRSVGVYAFKTNANPSPTANCQIELSPAPVVVPGEIYRMGYDAKHIGEGERWYILIDGGFVDYLNPWMTDWLKFAFYYKATGATLAVVFKERSPQNNGGIYLDNYSLNLAIF